MNILIDAEVKAQLDPLIIQTIEFGSTLRGDRTAQSDRDFLHIIKNTPAMLAAPVYTHHLLQYKNNNEDHIYCTVTSFVKGLIDGDSTVFIEILRSGRFRGSQELSTLHTYMDKFSTYRMAKALVGTAERDIRECSKLFSHDDYKSRKKYKFALMGLKMAFEVASERWPDAALDWESYVPVVPDVRLSDAVENLKHCNEITQKLATLRRDLNALNEHDQRNKKPWMDPDFAYDIMNFTKYKNFWDLEKSVDKVMKVIGTRAANFE